MPAPNQPRPSYASGTRPGIVSLLNQVFAGLKTFATGLAIPFDQNLYFNAPDNTSYFTYDQFNLNYISNGQTRFTITDDGDVTVFGSIYFQNGSHQSSASTTRELSFISANTSLSVHDVVLVNATSASVTITLPDPAVFPGKQYVIKKTDASVNSVFVAAAHSIEGQASWELSAQYQVVRVVNDGATWLVI